MKLQRCDFRETKETGWRTGVACLSKGFGFDACGVAWIVDENGNKVPSPYDYLLHGGPLAYIDTGYRD